MCRIYFCEIAESNHMELSEKLISMVSENKRERIKKLRFPVDQMLAAYSELLVRFIACSQFEIQNSEISFLKNEYGKPYLYGYPDFHFNISHTHNAFVVAVSDSEVGVDIERIHAADIKISDRFFAPAERKFISQAFDKDTAFYQIWTKKEAYIKYLGKGLYIPLSSFCVLDDKLIVQIQSFDYNGYLISVCGVQAKKTVLVDVQQPLIWVPYTDFLNKA